MFILQKKGIFFYLNTPGAPPTSLGGRGERSFGGGAIFQIGGALGGPHPCLPPTHMESPVIGVKK